MKKQLLLFYGLFLMMKGNNDTTNDELKEANNTIKVDQQLFL